MSNETRILVTGGSGLVGNAIKKVISGNINNNCSSKSVSKEKWIFVDSKDCDLTDLIATRALFIKHFPTHVINLAAMVGGLFHNISHNLDFFTKNMSIVQNVLKCCDETNVQKCISCLSTCIFPDKMQYPIDETMIHNGPPHNSNFGYSYAKRMVDILNRCYAQEKKRKYTSIIPCNIFGPYDNYNLESAHVIPALIHKIYKAKTESQSLIVYGTGAPLRQFIFSEDLAKLIVWALHYYEEIDPIIFSVDEKDEISISTAVQEIVKVFDFKGEIIFNSSEADGQYKKTASNKKLRRYLPDFKFTPFSEAIQESVNWFIKNYDKARK